MAGLAQCADLGGRDITSVQYQNANNSVRVSDEFMHAVEKGEKWKTIARTTGEAVKSYVRDTGTEWVDWEDRPL